jgi:putative membrane protein
VGDKNMHSVKENHNPNKIQIALLILCTAALILSFIKPKDYLTWSLEAFPVIVGVIVLIATRKTFQFTNLVYILISIVIITMLIGAHYTYEREPLFNWIKKVYGLKRNNYDRVGHLLQGFVPAFIVREILVRKFKLMNRKLLGMLVVCICLSISAFYELIEWGAALVGGGKAKDFLGAQGDKWDTHWDMFLALCGAIIMVTMFYKVHDKYIRKVHNEE